MASIAKTAVPPDGAQPPPTCLPPVEAGDRLDQKSFHERYESMPEDSRAELVGGVVHVPSPLKRPHSRMHVQVTRWLGDYEEETPGTEAFDNATTILDPLGEPQPDGGLLITVPGIGQTREQNQYTVGAPELVVEVASSTEAIDLHRKRADYERAGVKEYIVVALREARVFWFVARDGTFTELLPESDGILRSRVFLGLWLDPAALLRRDGRRVRQVLRQGLASPEHTAFLARLSDAIHPQG